MTVSSNHHVELNPSDAGFQDRVVVMGLIKEIAQSQTIETSKGKPFKVVVLTEVDSMSKDAQQALRRTMEKYQANCRIVLLCNNPCKVIEPLRSRCLGVRVGAPTNDEVTLCALQSCCRTSNTYYMICTGGICLAERCHERGHFRDPR